MRSLVTALMLGALALSVSPARAEISEAAKEAARERFARGIERLKAADHAGAVAEFAAAYEIAPYPVILYNLGIAYDRLDRPVEAAGAMEKVIAEPGTLAPERIAKAQEVLAAQTRRIGTLVIEASPADASIRVDGVDASAGRVRVAAGTHFVEAIKRGYAPARQQATVAGQREVAVRLTLEATDVLLAQLWIRSKLPDAEIWLDDRRVGTTPLRQSLPVLPGPHEVELRRPGYAPARDRIELGAGATGEVVLEPIEDRDAIERDGARLTLEAEAAGDLVLTIDGRRYGPYQGTLALAPGRHDIRVERAGFLPTTLQVEVPKGQTVSRAVVLDPTAETIAEHNHDVALFRGLGWTATALGVLTLGAGAGLAGYYATEHRRLDDELTAALVPGARCDSTALGYDEAGCTDLARSVDAARLRSRVGYGLVGAGGALAITGIVLLVAGPDADRYAPSLGEDGDPFAGLRLAPWLAPGTAGLVAGGRF